MVTLLLQISALEFVSQTHTLGRFKHHMHKEIHEQSVISSENINRLFSTESPYNDTFTNALAQAKRCTIAHVVRAIMPPWLQNTDRIGVALLPVLK